MKVKFAERLKELRIENGLSQTELAKIFKVSHTTVYHWENGAQQPSYEVLADIAVFFKVSANYLLGLEDF